MARSRGVLFAALVVALVVCAQAQELPKKNVPLTREQLEHIQERKEEDQFQAQVDQLNSQVFPQYDKPAKGEWTHESADAMQKHWENIVNRDSGMAEDEPSAKQAMKTKMLNAKIAQAKHAAHKAIHKELHPHPAAKHSKATHKPAAHEETHKVVEKKAATHPHPVKPAAHHEHEVHKKKWIKPHAKLWGVPHPSVDTLFAKKPTEKQEAAAELAEFKKINDAAFPSEHAAVHHHETAEQMHEKRQAEVNSAFPSKWEAQEEKVQVIGGPKENRGKPLGMDQKEVEIQRSLIGKRQFHSERMHAMEMNSVVHTDEERADAAKTAEGELEHLAKLSSEVLPKTPAEIEHAKKLAAQRAELQARMEAIAKAKEEHAKKMRAKHAAHRAEMQKEKAAHKTKLWPLAYKQHMLQKKNMPPSSDTEVPSAGTDIAYLGAHQAGFAKGQHKPAAPKHAAHKH